MHKVVNRWKNHIFHIGHAWCIEQNYMAQEPTDSKREGARVVLLVKIKLNLAIYIHLRIEMVYL